VGGSQDLTVQGFRIMSFSHSQPRSFGESFRNHRIHLPVPLESGLPFVQSADGAIDEALRSVELPEGFNRRLTLLLGSMTDEVSGSVDYLGC
jgi:hypothetical protein